MKKILLSLFAMISWAAGAQTPVHYGYAPDNVVPEEIQAQGTGENAFVGGMICRDPADPVVQRLKGHQVKGIRCYLRAEYIGKRQKRTYIQHVSGTPDATATKTYCDFAEGWNELMFDEPVTIGDEKLYVGLQVYELRGTPYPLVCYAGVSVPGGSWINLKSEGWKEYSDRGTLFIQAILDDEAAPKLQNTVYAQVASAPLTIAPARMFNAKVYVHNRSAQPIESLELATIGQGDTDAHTQTINFSTPLPAYGGRIIDLPVRAGSETGASQWLELTVQSVNGAATQAAAAGRTVHYITEDAFLRIPLVEEFTSQRCTNCPFMIYYLDKAMEEFSGPVLYVTHHTGFQDDAFTQSMDADLLYLFGSDYTYNPAVMYDRCVPKGEVAPVIGANEASSAPYAAAIAAATARPAMAEVLVDVEKSDTQISCRVHGRVNSEMAASGEPLYLSVYLVENGIPLDKYPQLGLDADGAPADIMERFKHNGVKRHVFNTVSTGDPLTLQADNTFSVDFAAANFSKAWNWDNCQGIAFVHKINKDDMTKNEVLNAGSNKLNHLITGIQTVNNGASTDVRFSTNAGGTLQANVPLRRLQIHQLDGRSVSTDMPLNSGIYVVNYTLHNGETGARKVIVNR